MNMVWDRYVSNSIREPGYDAGTRTMTGVVPGNDPRYHAPVPFPSLLSIFPERFPEQLYNQTVEGHITIVSAA
jgi:hypothetical protein